MAIDNRVFPTSDRVAPTGNAVDAGTNLVTEYNIASITKNLTDQSSYVISGPTGSPATMEFVIDGYYFKIDASFLSNTATSITGDYIKLQM